MADKKCYVLVVETGFISEKELHFLVNSLMLGNLDVKIEKAEYKEAKK